MGPKFSQESWLPRTGRQPWAGSLALRGCELGCSVLEQDTQVPPEPPSAGYGRGQGSGKGSSLLPHPWGSSASKWGYEESRQGSELPALDPWLNLAFFQFWPSWQQGFADSTRLLLWSLPVCLPVSF